MFGRIKRQLTKGDKYFQENCRKRRLVTQTLSKLTVLWLPTRYQSFKFRYQHQRRRRRRRRRGWTQSGKLRVLSEIVAPQRDISRRQQIWPWPFNIFLKRSPEVLQLPPTALTHSPLSLPWTQQDARTLILPPPSLSLSLLTHSHSLSSSSTWMGSFLMPKPKTKVTQHYKK